MVSGSVTGVAVCRFESYSDYNLDRLSNWLAQRTVNPPSYEHVGSSPTRSTNKVTVPRVDMAISGLKRIKVTDGCVTPWTTDIE